MYVVFGATGNTGHVVAETLLGARSEGAGRRAGPRQGRGAAGQGRRGREGRRARPGEPGPCARGRHGEEDTSSSSRRTRPPTTSSAAVAASSTATSAALRKSPVAHAAVLSSVAAQHEKGTGPIGDHALRRGRVRQGHRHRVHLRARRLLHGEHPRQRAPHEGRRRAAGVRRRRRLPVPHGRDPGHRRGGGRGAAREHQGERLDRALRAQGVQHERRRRDRREAPRPRGEDRGAADRCDGPHARPVRPLGQHRPASTAR